MSRQYHSAIRRGFQRSGHHWLPSGDYGEDTAGQGLYTVLNDWNITLQAHFISKLCFTRYFFCSLTSATLSFYPFRADSEQQIQYSLSRMVERGRRFLQAVINLRAWVSDKRRMLENKLAF